LKIKHTALISPNKTLEQAIKAYFLCLLIMLPGCGATIEKEESAGLSLINMESLLLLSREFKRARLIEDMPQLKPLASRIEAEAALLKSMNISAEFTKHADNMVKIGAYLTSAITTSDLKSIDTRFNNLMASCISCHKRFR